MSQPAQPLDPDWSQHPGEELELLLEQRGMRQTELAERTGLSAKHVNQIVRGAIGVSGDVAVLLERVFGQPSARDWLRADADHQAFLSSEKARGRLADYHPWLKEFDAKTLLRHGIVEQDDDTDRRTEKVLHFFGVASPTAFADTWTKAPVSFRRSQAFTVADENTALWMRLVEQQATAAGPAQPRRQAAKADGVPSDSGTRPRVRDLRRIAKMIPDYSKLSVVDGMTAARDALADAGVALCFVRQVPGTRVNGAAWWPRGNPVIGLTERGRKADLLWFTLLHELAHLALHPRRETFLDLELDKGDEPDAAEREADEFAETILVPPGARARIAAATSRAQLVRISLDYGMAASTVAGQHGHNTNKWAVGASLRVRLTDSDVDQLEAL